MPPRARKPARAQRPAKPRRRRRRLCRGASSPLDTWPHRTAAAEALGLTRQRFSAWCRAGCPAAKTGRVNRLAVMSWAWLNRHAAVAADWAPTDQATADAIRVEQLEKLKLQNAKTSSRHLVDAQQLVRSRFLALAESLGRDLALAVGRLWTAAQHSRVDAEPLLTAILADHLDAARRTAITEGAA